MEYSIRILKGIELFKKSLNFRKPNYTVETYKLLR